MDIDLLIFNAAQVATCASPDGPKRGPAMQDVGLIESGAVAVNQGKILEVGASASLRRKYRGRREIDAAGKTVCPGFVDPHTHVVYAGNRVHEFEMRIRGATYMEIMQAGGGIASTMRATRQASIDELVQQSSRRLETMRALGTTTVEVKTGYGLETQAELKMLQAIAELDAASDVDLVPTFLGAHAVPPDFNGTPDRYVDLVVEEMIPAAAEWYAASDFKRRGTPCFCDVFCEAGVFDLSQSRRVLEAGLAHGLRSKIHADEFKNLGGVTLAVELEAVSVDHLDATSEPEVELLARSDVIAVALPVVNFNLGSTQYARARQMIDAGVALALSTDINPGSAPCPSMPIVMNIASRYLRVLPSEALNACTLNAAYAIGWGQRFGSIEPGKQADLLILNTTDYRSLAYEIGGNLVEQVIKHGK